MAKCMGFGKFSVLKADDQATTCGCPDEESNLVSNLQTLTAHLQVCGKSLEVRD